MNGLKWCEKLVVSSAVALGGVVLLSLVGGVAMVFAQGFGSVHTPDALQAYQLSMAPGEHGQFTVRGNFAAHEWHPVTDAPSRVDSKAELRWPILADRGKGQFVTIYYGRDTPEAGPETARFRSSSWYPYTAPIRWAYIRQQPEVWSAAMQRMEVPGVAPALSVVSILPAMVGPTKAPSLTFTVLFSDDAVGFDWSDVLIVNSNTAHTGVQVTGGPRSYSVTVMGITGDGSFKLSVDPQSDVRSATGGALVSKTVARAAMGDVKDVPLWLYNAVKGLMATVPWQTIMDAGDMVESGIPPKGEPE